MTREEAVRILGEAAPDISREFGVASLHLFGSMARGTHRDGSDVDILVSFRPGARVTLFTLARLASVLEDALGVRVDVVEDHRGLRPSFRAAIERDKLRVA